MNEEARKILDSLTKKEIAELTPQDIAFMRARRSYMTKDQKNYYAEVLEEKRTFDELSPDMPLQELKKYAAEVGLTWRVGTTKEKFIEQIKEARENG